MLPFSLGKAKFNLFAVKPILLIYVFNEGFKVSKFFAARDSLLFHGV